mmetsp:Transcript_12264/g.24921  ORF Transcript_12264/g.24921 Transcript_12264/m.24921 type:complete len:117 (+) Transcript_12264:163-513(+)|eukprot:CAMPEP_0171606484 /NCGR_PEP_ID=MMETSP0990-20121206/7792_1 /TAXON_ID=483369 /ORGANISM="non described non described, Strain CCMP2098" /LENGTH=116 /DNA_ID=CAMNT_0012169333 /DNA_START=153 /DNA_END=503 /DNA_ORIENTATION=-
MTHNDKFRKYRASTSGQTLGQTLLSLISENCITKGEATAILDIFDEGMNSRVNVPPPQGIATESATIEGDMDYYNSYAGLWRVRIKNARVRGIGLSQASNITILAEEQPILKKRKR